MLQKYGTSYFLQLFGYELTLIIEKKELQEQQLKGHKFSYNCQTLLQQKTMIALIVVLSQLLTVHHQNHLIRYHEFV